MSHGGLIIVLHAHLPFVRHEGEPYPHRDDWLQEALVESYLPLLKYWTNLMSEDVPFRLTLSLSPTLITMLGDDFLREQCVDYLDGLVEIGEMEIDRLKDEPEFLKVAQFYLDRVSELRKFYLDELNCDIISAVKPLVDGGRLELITTAATHGFLPGLKPSPNSVKGQIMTGLDTYEKFIGGRPQGFWLPECGYSPDIDEFLAKEGIRYFITGAEALTHARPTPKFNLHAPVFTKNGVAAFARDRVASEQVWSSIIGYPGDPDYREFYRDIGYDLDYDYLADYLPPDGERKDTGYKYYRITGYGMEKQVYNRENALSKAGLHSGHFLDTLRGRAWDAGHQMGRNPIIVAPFDAELYGHWWFEGPEWLDYLVRKIIYDQDDLELMTPSDYLDANPVNQVVELCPSTWGRDGYNKVWINQRNDYIYRHLHWASRRMAELAKDAVAGPRRENPDSLKMRAIKQAARELLLAQSSDWPFMMEDDNTADYGHTRFREHTLNFIGLYRQIESNKIDGDRLAELESAHNVFPEINLINFT